MGPEDGQGEILCEIFGDLFCNAIIVLAYGPDYSPKLTTLLKLEQILKSTWLWAVRTYVHVSSTNLCPLVYTPFCFIFYGQFLVTTHSSSGPIYRQKMFLAFFLLRPPPHPPEL